MKVLSNNQIKTIAMILMTIDHIGYIFELDPIFRIIGRLSLSLFAFLIYQGFLQTRNIIKYFRRLFVFGFIIEILLLIINQFVSINNIPINIFMTLSFGLLGLMVLDSKESVIFKIAGIFVLSFISEIMHFDYGWYGIILITSFYFTRYNMLIPLIIHMIINYIDYYFFNYDIQYFALFSWLIIILYNGKLGNKMKHRSIMYFYYPVHLALLFTIKMYLFS